MNIGNRIKELRVKNKVTQEVLNINGVETNVVPIETEIINDIEKALVKGKDTPVIKIKDLYDYDVEIQVIDNLNFSKKDLYSITFENIQEKFDCGGITSEEWNLIKSKHD